MSAIHYVSISGGKDSTATACLAVEKETPPVDTGRNATGRAATRPVVPQPPELATETPK